MESNPNNTVQEPVVLSMDEERHKKEASSAMELGHAVGRIGCFTARGCSGAPLSSN